MKRIVTPALKLASTTMICLGTAAAHAETVDSRPAMSDAYSVENARTAMDEVKQRWELAQTDMQTRMATFKGDLADFVRTDPVLQNVTWPYETCTDLQSIVPPPSEGWGIRSDAPFTTNPIEDERAHISLVTYDAALTPADEEFFSTERSVAIHFSTDPANLTYWELTYADPTIREISYEAGPYGYPIRKMDKSVVLGDVAISITATDTADRDHYLAEMIRCAIDGGFLAPGVDPEILTETR